MMTVSAGVLRTYLDYSAWAAGRMLKGVAKLSPEELTRDFGTSDKSVVGTLAHVFGSERSWLARVQGRPPSPFLTDGERDLDVLRREWPGVLQAWQQWASGLTDDNVTQACSYKDMRGNPWTTAWWKIVLHL